MSEVRIAAKRFPESVLILLSQFKDENGVYQIPAEIVDKLVAHPASLATAVLKCADDESPNLTKRVHTFLATEVPRGTPVVIVPSEQSGSEQHVGSLIGLDYLQENSPNSNCLNEICCPECGSHNGVSIMVLVSANFSDDGSEIDGGDHEYDDNSSCTCGSCNHTGTVKDFYTLHDE